MSTQPKVGRPETAEHDKKRARTVSISFNEERAILKATKQKTLTHAILTLKPNQNEQ